MVYEKQGSISKSFMTSRILSVVIIVNELLRGGAQRIILNLARDIDKGKFSITVVYLKSHKNFGPDAATLEDELRQTGIRVISLEGAQRFTPTDLLKLIRLLRNEKPDIVHTFLPYAGTLGRIAARIAGVPRIVSVQCNVRVAYDFWRYWLDRATLILAHAWIGATEGIELEYGGSVAHFSKEEWNRGRRHFSIPSGVNMEAIAESLAQLDRSKKRRELEVPSAGACSFAGFCACLLRGMGPTSRRTSRTRSRAARLRQIPPSRRTLGHIRTSRSCRCLRSSPQCCARWSELEWAECLTS